MAKDKTDPLEEKFRQLQLLLGGGVKGSRSSKKKKKQKKKNKKKRNYTKCLTPTQVETQFTYKNSEAKKVHLFVPSKVKSKNFCQDEKRRYKRSEACRSFTRNARKRLIREIRNKSPARQRALLKTRMKKFTCTKDNVERYLNSLDKRKENRDAQKKVKENRRKKFRQALDQKIKHYDEKKIKDVLDSMVRKVEEEETNNQVESLLNDVLNKVGQPQKKATKPKPKHLRHQQQEDVEDVDDDDEILDDFFSVSSPSSSSPSFSASSSPVQTPKKAKPSSRTPKRADSAEKQKDRSKRVNIFSNEEKEVKRQIPPPVKFNRQEALAKLKRKVQAFGSSKANKRERLRKEKEALFQLFGLEVTTPELRRSTRKKSQTKK